MKNKTKKVLMSALFVLMVGTLCMGIALPKTTAYAWSSWDTPKEHLIDDMNSLSYDANGWETTIATGAWQHGGKATAINAQGMTEVTTQEQGPLFSNAKMDLTGNKAAQFKFSYSAGSNGFWIMLVSENIWKAGQRLNPSANERNGLPVAVNFSIDASGNWKIIHYEHNGFNEANSNLTGSNGSAEHTLTIYAGSNSGEDKSFVLIDNQLLYAPALNISAFENNAAYICLFQKDNDSVLKLSKPVAVEKPETYAVELPAAKRADVGGEGVTLTPTANAMLEAAGATYEWSSSDNNIATVNKNGVVTGVAAGEATITVKAMKNGAELAKATCKMTVCAYDESGWLNNVAPASWGIGVKDGEVNTDAEGNATFKLGHSNEVWNRKAIDLSQGPVYFDYELAMGEGDQDWCIFGLLNTAERQKGDRVSNVNPAALSFYTHNNSTVPTKEKVVEGQGEEVWNAACENKNRVVIYVGEQAGTSYIAINGKKIYYNATLDNYKTGAEGSEQYLAYLHMFPAFDATELTVSPVKTGAAVLLGTESISMQVKENKTFDYEVVGTDAAATVTVADPTVVSIGEDNKTLTGLKKGKTTVTVTAGDYSVVMNVEVGDIVVESIELSHSGQVEIKVGQTLELFFTVTPEDYTEELNVYWESSKTSRATVVVNEEDATKATVTAVGEGLVDITVEVNGIQQYVTLNVSAADPEVPDSSSSTSTETSDNTSTSESTATVDCESCSGGMGVSTAIFGIAVLGSAIMFSLKKKEN